MKLNQKGFSVIEILIVIVVVGLLSAVGWLVYDRQTSKSTNSTLMSDTTPKPSTNTSTTPSETLPEGFIEYTNKELGVKFNHPKRWGTVTVSQHARNREDFEPVKTHYILFSYLPKFMIIISPNTWKSTGGQSEWNFPINDTSFKESHDSKTALQILTNDNTYLQMVWSGFSGSVTLQGAKKQEISKIPANYAEFEWAPVSDNCASEGADGAKTPQLSCYGEDLVSETKKVVDSFKAY